MAIVLGTLEEECRFIKPSAVPAQARKPKGVSMQQALDFGISYLLPTEPSKVCKRVAFWALFIGLGSSFSAGVAPCRSLKCAAAACESRFPACRTRTVCTGRCPRHECFEQSLAFDHAWLAVREASFVAAEIAEHVRMGYVVGRPVSGSCRKCCVDVWGTVSRFHVSAPSA